MTTTRTGGLRIRWPARRMDGQVHPDDRAVGQAAPSGAARSSNAAPEGTAVGNCDDQQARIMAGRVAFRARLRARQAEAQQEHPIASQTSPSRVSLQQGSESRVRGRQRAVPEETQFQVPERPHTTPEGVPNASRQISVRTNLPNRLPILSIEIALVENALSEFLSSRVAANDNEDEAENE